MKQRTATKEMNEQNANGYAAMLESYYADLVLNDRNGRVPVATHHALEEFLEELRELVLEEKTALLAKAA